MADETPQAAPAVDAGQPAPQAVESVPAGSPSPESGQAPAPAATAPEQTSEKLWAGKYKAPEILEEAYTHAQSENSRMAQELSTLRRQQTAPTTPTPTPTNYTPDQLETWKEQWLVKAATEPDKAVEAAHQIRMIDAELRNQAVRTFETRTSQQQELQRLTADMMPLIEKYKADLVPGQPAHSLAEDLYRRALAAGAPDNLFIANWAVSQALLKVGKLGQVDTVKASTAATNSLNQALKGAAAAGSGAANANAASAPDWKNMSSDEFRKARTSLGVGK